MTLQIVASLNDDFRGIINDHNIFIIQATGEQNQTLKSYVAETPRVLMAADTFSLLCCTNLTFIT